jgi:phosphotransferase system HPr (HPr) family protein
MPEIRLLVIDPTGLHARPAAKFVQLASRFASRIVIRQANREADAKSLSGVLGLTLRPSTEITVSAEGPDALDALAALKEELTPYVTPLIADSALIAKTEPA